MKERSNLYTISHREPQAVGLR